MLALRSLLNELYRIKKVYDLFFISFALDEIPQLPQSYVVNQHKHTGIFLTSQLLFLWILQSDYPVAKLNFPHYTQPDISFTIRHLNHFLSLARVV